MRRSAIVSRWKKSQASRPFRLGTQELPPTRVRPPRRWPDSIGGQDTADRSGTDPPPQADQLSLDPPMPPARVIPGQPQHQIPDLFADPRAARPGPVRPPPRDQPPVPAQQRAWGNQAMGAQPGRQHPGQSNVTAEHRDLMPKNQQLRRLRRVTTRQQYQPSQDLNQCQVHQPEHHSGIIHLNGETPAHVPCDEFWHGTGCGGG